MKTKIKIIGDKICTSFYGKEMSKKNTPHKCLSLIMVDSVLRINNKYYPQTLLEECKYKIKNCKMKSHIDYGFDSDSSDDSENEPDSGSDNESEKSSKKPDNESDSN